MTTILILNLPRKFNTPPPKSVRVGDVCGPLQVRAGPGARYLQLCLTPVAALFFEAGKTMTFQTNGGNFLRLISNVEVIQVISPMDRTHLSSRNEEKTLEIEVGALFVTFLFDKEPFKCSGEILVS